MIILKKKILLILSYILVAVVAVQWTMILTAPREPEYEKLLELEALVQEKYIDEVNKAAIEDAAAAAMAAQQGMGGMY